MKKASEYLVHAEECRALARAMKECEHRTQLLEMAATWEGLAEERSALVGKNPDLAKNARPWGRTRDLTRDTKEPRSQ